MNRRGESDRRRKLTAMKDFRMNRKPHLDVEQSRRGFARTAGTAGLVMLGGLWVPTLAAERKFDAKEDFDPAVITQSAQVIHDFIENYHEKSEEQHVFPRFEKANQMLDLVSVLLLQHQAGRRVTAMILQLAPDSRRDDDKRRELITSMRSFITMYRPHAAREDTDLFPKLQKVVSRNEYEAMAEDFENEEHRLFGEDGFEKMTDRVASLEQMIGIHDLAKFTPS